MPGANVAARDDSGKRCADAGLLQLEFERTLGLLRVDEEFLHAFDVPLVRLGFEAGVVVLLLGNELGFPHFSCAFGIGVEYLGFGFPVLEIGGGAAGAGSGGVEIGGGLAIVELG